MTHELIAQPDADKDRNDCARNRDDSAKHSLFHEGDHVALAHWLVLGRIAIPDGQSHVSPKRYRASVADGLIEG